MPRKAAEQERGIGILENCSLVVLNMHWITAILDHHLLTDRPSRRK